MFLEYLNWKDILKSKGYSSWKNYYTTTNDTTTTKGPVVLYPSFLIGLENEKSFLSKRNYFRYTKFQNTPVLRITKVMAEDYCQWRTEMVEYAWKYFPKYLDQKEFSGKIKYRLPSVEELKNAKNYFSEKGQLVMIKKRNPLRYKPSADTLEFTLYNISEYTSSKVLFGENWKEELPTKFPNDLTGFRCVCIIE